MPVSPKDEHKKQDKKESALGLANIKQAAGLFLRFNQYLLRYWPLQFAIFTLGCLSTLSFLCMPFMGRGALDRGIIGGNANLFFKYTLLGGAFFFLRFLFSNTRSYLVPYLRGKISVSLYRVVLRKIGRLSLQTLQAKPAGEWVYRINSDVENCAGIIATTLPDLLEASFTFLAVIVIIFFISWKILFFIILYQVLGLVQTKLFTAKYGKAAQANIDSSQAMTRNLSSVFSHIYVIKAAGKMPVVIRIFFRNVADKIRSGLRSARLSMFSTSFTTVSNRLFIGGMSFVGSYLVMKKQLTLGSLGAVMSFVMEASTASNRFFNSLQRIVTNRISLRRLAEVLDAEIIVREKTPPIEAVFTGGEIAFKRVSFGYAEGKEIISGMDFSIAAGSRVAIAGRSGCGKTTLLNLILRLYDVSTGAILIDGCDVRELSFKSLCSQVGIIYQSSFLWNDTIKANLAFEKPHASDDEMKAAAMFAEADAFIADLAKGYETHVGEDGYTFSQGQKQRLAIARVLVKKPKILLIDEGLSSIDRATEEKILGNIKAALKDSTVVLVSHRLSALKSMDAIYFFKSPSEMVRGTHDELQQSCAEYRGLFDAPCRE